MNKNFLMIVMVLISVGIVGGALLFAGTLTDIEEQNQLKKFSSYDELKDFLKANREKMSYSYGGFGGIGSGFGRFVTKGQMFATASTGALESRAAAPSGSEDYSTTNIQVAGVDEADIIKNDGKYIYTVVGNKLVIVDAYPAEEARVVSETVLKGNPTEIFVNRDRLVVFAQAFDNIRETSVKAKPLPPGTVRVAVIDLQGETRMDIYDISNKEKPELARSIVVSGSYHDSRMIGDYVYAIVNQPVRYYEPQQAPLPVISEAVEGKAEAKEVVAADIYYFDSPDYNYNYINIVSVNTQNEAEDYNSKTFLAGSAQNMYVSLGNIYVTYTKRNDIYTMDSVIDNVIVPVVPGIVAAKIGDIRKSATGANEKMRQIGEALQDYTSSLGREENEELEKDMQQKMVEYERKLEKEREKTIVHKIAISDGKIEYKGQGSVPGHMLNQFSMDEHRGYFRIATTTTESSFGSFSTQVASVQISPATARTNTNSAASTPDRTLPNPPESRPTSQNHIYVLDENLRVVGAVEDLAPGEKIYSARFMGDRAYMVTFKKVDPLFVIDISEPTNPKVLGKLKIPGYSDYLHPYDENHIIGLGKETVAAEEGDFAWYQGIKLALFDVSDPENPREVSKYNIGDRGTDSYALQDHKAFLFSKSKNLLVIPILLAEIDETKYAGQLPPNAYGNFVWQGAYVFSLDTENGFDLKGRVTHLDTEEGEQQMLKSGYYFRSEYDVKRSIYMDDVLYTLSDRMIKMNDLVALEEVNKIELPK